MASPMPLDMVEDEGFVDAVRDLRAISASPLSKIKVFTEETVPQDPSADPACQCSVMLYRAFADVHRGIANVVQRRGADNPVRRKQARILRRLFYRITTSAYLEQALHRFPEGWKSAYYLKLEEVLAAWEEALNEMMLADWANRKLQDLLSARMPTALAGLNRVHNWAFLYFTPRAGWYGLGGDFDINRQTRKVKWRGQELDLGRGTKFHLFVLLAENLGKKVSPRDILYAAYGVERAADKPFEPEHERTIQNRLSDLRNLLIRMDMPYEISTLRSDGIIMKRI